MTGAKATFSLPNISKQSKTLQLHFGKHAIIEGVECQNKDKCNI